MRSTALSIWPSRNERRRRNRFDALRSELGARPRHVEAVCDENDSADMFGAEDLCRRALRFRACCAIASPPTAPAPRIRVRVPRASRFASGSPPNTEPPVTSTGNPVSARDLGTVTHSLERQVAKRVAAAVLRGVRTNAAAEDDDCLRVPGARQIQGWRPVDKGQQCESDDRRRQGQQARGRRSRPRYARRAERARASAARPPPAARGLSAAGSTPSARPL